MMRRIRSQFGVTIIELTVVVAIIGVLAAATIMTLIGMETQVKHKAAIDLLATLDLALGQYHEIEGHYPDPGSLSDEIPDEDKIRNSEELWLLLERVHECARILERINAKYIVDRSADSDTVYRGLIDPWGVELRYVFSENYPIVRSAGPDRRFNTPDDITNLDTQL